MAKKTITTIVKKADECVIYHDDGMFCTWTDKQKFDFNLIADVKAKADGLVLLAPVEEVKAFNGTEAKIDDHEAWVINRDLIWLINGELEPRANEVELINFMRGLII